MDDFRTRVLRVVRAVPPGSVTTYGTVAALAGNPGAARQVGVVLRGSTDADGDVPWQRVINASGGISTYKVGAGELQVALLRSEGVEVVADRVHLLRFGWTPDDDIVLAGPSAAPHPTNTSDPKK